MQAELNALVGPVVEGLGFELWGLEYLVHGRRGHLKVYIDSPDGVDVDDCAAGSCATMGRTRALSSPGGACSSCTTTTTATPWRARASGFSVAVYEQQYFLRCVSGYQIILDILQR